MIGCRSSQNVEAKITELDDRFYDLKNQVREYLEKRGVVVERVADALMSLSADDMEEHKQFLKSHFNELFRAANLSELFGIMNFNWNYLSYHLLDYLVRRFKLEEVKGEMEAYKKDLQQFREKTPLTAFCQTQKKRWLSLDSKFPKMVARFAWPNDVTLEVVEQFRQKYAYHYNLHECAMMLAEVLPGCFIITWFIPESIVEKLRANVPRVMLGKHKVTDLKVAGRCVYHVRKQLNQSGFYVCLYSHIYLVLL